MTSTMSIVSGYFNPLHVGHLRMMQDARRLGDLLLVIVNNDAQQLLKKGKIILSEADRLEIVTALSCVDQVVLSIDRDASVRETLKEVRAAYPAYKLIFANGGDRSTISAIAEFDTCNSLGIDIRLGVGGEHKADSSSRINSAIDAGEGKDH